MQNKSQLRKTLNEKRKAIPFKERGQAALNAAQLFSQSDLFAAANHIACYLAMDYEFDCKPVIQEIWQANKKCYLPMISQHKKDILDFVLYQPEDKLQANRYNILEPIHSQLFPAEKLDIVLMPLVGFDSHGNRLGMGKGYYDRTFEFLKTHKDKKPFLIGLAYEFQQSDNLPKDEWDIPLNGVVTEQKIKLF